MRLAVREIESWLLADKSGFCGYFNIPKDRLMARPDDLPDPKQFLIRMIKQYCKNKNYRDGIAPYGESGAVQGPAYNQTLIPFVQKAWNMRRAGKESPSLSRCFQAIKRHAWL